MWKVNQIEIGFDKFSESSTWKHDLNEKIIIIIFSERNLFEVLYEE